MSNHKTTEELGLDTASFRARGERSGRARLTTHQVIEIRNRYACGQEQLDAKVTMRALAAAFGVSTMQIKRIVHREQWKHIQ
jgi:hypothetical protein